MRRFVKSSISGRPGRTAAPVRARRGLYRRRQEPATADPPLLNCFSSRCFGKPSPGLTQDENLTRANGVALLNDLAEDAFVRLRCS